MKKHTRGPQIVADAAYAIVCQPSKKFTGKFCIDEDVLVHQGVTNLGPYAMVPGTEDLYSDGYIEPEYRTPKLPKQVFKPASRI